MTTPTMLYIFSGLPGTGKSTLAAALARQKDACYLRIDTIEQALREAGFEIDGPAGYMAAYGVALDNLRLGLRVVADAVNPIAITRQAWHEVARRAGVPHIDIEVVCSDEREHRQRVESRVSDIPGLRLPTWEEVVARNYELWQTEHLQLDTAGETPEQSSAKLLKLLKHYSG